METAQLAVGIALGSFTILGLGAGLIRDASDASTKRLKIARTAADGRAAAHGAGRRDSGPPGRRGVRILHGGPCDIGVCDAPPLPFK